MTEPTAPLSAPAHRGVRRIRALRRRTLVLVGLLLAVLVGVGINVRLLLDPDEVRRRAQAALGEIFAGPVTIASAEIRLPNVLVLNGVRVESPSEPGRAAIVLPRVRIAFSLAAALTGNTTPRRISFEGAELHVRRRADGTLDLTDLLRPRSTTEARRPELRLSGGRVVYHDEEWLRPGAVARARDLEVHVPRTGTIRGRGIIERVGAISFSVGSDRIDVRVDGIRLESPIEKILAPGLIDPLIRFRPEGRADLGLVLDRTATGVARPRLRVDLRGVRLAPTLDHLPSGRTFEVEDVRGRLLLDEEALEIRDVTARHGTSELLLRGRIQDPGRDATYDLTVAARGLVLDQAIREVVPDDIREIADAYDLRLLADGTARLRTDAPRAALDPEVRVHVRGGRMRYRGYERPEDGVRTGFPYWMDVLGGRVDYHSSRMTLHEIFARHGPVPIRAGGSVRFETLDACDVDVSIVTQGMAVDDELRAAFGEKTEYILEPFAIEGRVGRTHVRALQDATSEEGAYVRVEVQVDGGVSVRPGVLPLAVREVHGRVRFGPAPELGPGVELATFEGVRGIGHGGASVRMDGHIRNWGLPDEQTELDVSVRDLTLDETVDAALEASELGPEVVSIWREMKPRGRLDAEFGLSVGRGEESFRVRLRPRNLAVLALPGLPYSLRGVEGVVRIEDDRFAVPWATSRAGSLNVRADATGSWQGLETLTLAARRLPVDGRLHRVLHSLVPEADEWWEQAQPVPGGVLDLDVRLRPDPDGEPSTEIAIEKPTLDLRPAGRHRTHVSAGRVAVRLPSGAFEIDRLEGSHNDAAFVVSGRTPAGGGEPVWTVTSDPLWPDRDLCGLLPTEVGEALEAATGGRIAMDPLRLSANGTEFRLDGSRLVFYPKEGASEGLRLQGGLRLETFVVGGDGALSGRLLADDLGLEAGIPMEGIRGHIDLDGSVGLTPHLTGSFRDLSGLLWGRQLAKATASISLERDLLRLDDVRGTLDGGKLRGKLSVSLKGDGALRLNAKLEDVRLNRFLARAGSLPDPELSGRLDAEIRLTKDGPTLDRLDGRGTVKIRDAALWDVPVFSAIFMALSAIPPIQYRPVFHSADIEFDVDGDILRMEAVEFRSDFVSLERGRGTISLFGDIDLMLVPKVRTIDIPGISDIWNLIKTGLIYRMRIRGTLDRPSATLEPLPFLHGGPDETPRVVPEFLGKIRKKKGLGL